MESVGTTGLWVGFLALIGLLLALDLGIFNRKDHVMGTRESLYYSLLWVLVALFFNFYIYTQFGSEKGLEFLTGYLVEKALSVDNIFVFLILFKFFSVPKKLEHRVLFFGILGALIMRGAFIIGGAFLLEKFRWITYLLGILLVATAVKLLKNDPDEIDPEENRALILARKIFPSTSNYVGHSFFVRQSGKWLATPLFFVLIAVETTDLVFAVDSIPAIFAITTDPFIVFTSNIFAILGLRALYFLLASLLVGLRFLRYGLSLVLGFIGIKMLAHDYLQISTGISLGVIAGLLGASIIFSILLPKKNGEAADERSIL
jgi:tellurite resistance protein TerC